MTTELEKNVGRLIRRGYHVEAVPGRLQGELLAKMFDWQDTLIEGAYAERRSARPAGRKRLDGLRVVAGVRPVGLGVLPQRRATGWRITALAAAVLIALGVLFRGQLGRFLPGAVSVATVSECAGPAQLLRAGETLPVSVGTALRVGDELGALEGAGRVRLAFSGRAQAELAAGARVFVRGRPEPGAELLFVKTGRVSLDIAPVSGRRPVSVGTPHAAVHVVGTRFAVDVGAEHTRAEVVQGIVRVASRAGDQAVELRAGEYAVVSGAHIVVAARSGVGVPAGRRAGSGPIVLYAFAEGRGTVVRDTAPRGPGQRPLDLAIGDPQAVRWERGGGLTVHAPVVIASKGPATRLPDACMASGELTIEAWITPEHVRQEGPVRVVELGNGALERNFELGMDHRWAPWGPHYSVRLRATSDIRGWPEAVTGPPAVEASLTHVVYTRDRSGGIQLYVNGRRSVGGLRPDPHSADAFRQRPPHSLGSLANWSRAHRLSLANTVTGDRAWLGTFHRVALYSRALTPAEATRLFQAGPTPQQQATAR